MNLLNFISISATLLLCSLISSASSQYATEEPFFSFEKLIKLNELAPCFSKIHREFQFCNREAHDRGRKYLEGVDMQSEWAKRVSCCGLWLIRDCWYAAALKRCPKEEQAAIYNLPYLMLGSRLTKECKNYPDGSDKCRIPIWLIVFIVLFVLALIASGILCGMWFYRRRQRKRQIREMNEQMDEKPTSV